MDFSGGIANKPTTDKWQTLSCPGAREVVFQVANAAIQFQFGDGVGQAVWDDEPRVLLPGYHVRDQRPCDAVRFKSLKAGAPAQLTVETA